MNGCHNMAENCSQRCARFVHDGAFKLLLAVRFFVHEVLHVRGPT